MFGLDSDIGGSALRLWVAAGSAALLVFVCALAIDWTRTRTVARVGVVIVGALLGATLAWTFLNGANLRDQSAERRALEARAAALNVQALAPGSPLACLDGLAGDSVEAACERALFASPATVAIATSYVAARLALLADITAYTKRGGGNIDGALLPLRRGLEADRFGFVAHTLAARDGCTGTECPALLLLRNPGAVRANLSGATLDRYLDHYVTAWAQSPGGSVTDVGPVASVGAPTADGAAPPRKSALNVDFPSSDSIPAISIMNPEPKGGTPTPAAAAAAVAAGQQTSAKVVGPQQMPPMPGMPAATASQSKEAAKEATKEATREAAKEAAAAKGKRKQAANPPAQTAAQAPAQAAPLDPVWNPGATLASPSPAPQPAAGVAPSPASASLPPASLQPPSSAPANSASSGVPLAGMPVQLTPFTSPQGQ
jgi:hypothetical protein